MSPIIMYCDPSTRAFGWITMQGDQIIEFGVEDFKGARDKKEALRDECSRMVETIYVFFMSHPEVTTVVTELPHGSQSANVAWYFGTLNSAIKMYCISNNVGYVALNEGVIKKLVHGRHKDVTKQNTIDTMIGFYPQFSYILERKTKKIKEALADTLAVFHAFKIGK